MEYQFLLLEMPQVFHQNLKKREIFKNNKVTDMISSDRIGVKGVWSDDSSMVIATMKADYR